MATRKSKAATAATEAAAPAATTTTAEADSEQGASLLQTGTDHAGEMADAGGRADAGTDSGEATQDQGAPDAAAVLPADGSLLAGQRPARLVDGIAAIAMVAHEVNRAYCESIGDNTQVAWAEASVDIQQSAIAGVEFKLATPEATPEQQHNAWCSSKIKAGWAYGPVKDAVARTHHCLVPYSALPLEQRVKDHLFGAVVSSMAAVALTNAPVGEAPPA